MDPQACLARWLAAEDAAETHDAAADLANWLEHGGFEPNWGPGLRDAFRAYCRGARIRCTRLNHASP